MKGDYYEHFNSPRICDECFQAECITGYTRPPCEYCILDPCPNLSCENIYVDTCKTFN